MNVAAAALTAVQAVAPQCIGCNLPDLTNPAGWTFFGKLDASARAAAVQAVQDAVLTGSSSAGFWPPLPTPLELDVATLKTKIGAA